MLQLPANPDDLSPTAVRSPPIFIAARHGDPGAADLLIRAGADPNAPCTCFSVLRNASLDNTPLHTAVQHPDGAIVQILCRARADLNAVDGKGDRHFDVVRLLACARANLDHASPDDDCGNTALQRAAWKGDEEGVRVLLHLGANANLPDRGGYSPLGASVWAGGGPATRLLLAARADVDGGHPSPLALAMQKEDRECAQLLLEAGASRAVASADHDAQENIYFVGHQNTPEQRAAVDDLVSAHNADAHWLMWFNPRKELSVMAQQLPVRPRRGISVSPTCPPRLARSAGAGEAAWLLALATAQQPGGGSGPRPSARSPFLAGRVDVKPSQNKKWLWL